MVKQGFLGYLSVLMPLFLKQAAEGAAGALKLTSERAWATPEPKPKTMHPELGKTKPDAPPPAKPPSKTKFYKDIQESLTNPTRGWRYAT